MDQPDQRSEVLGRLIGVWSMEATFPGQPPTRPVGRTTFEPLAGGPFLLQRWEVPHPDAPDGIAVITPSGDGYLQHYFDSRGVARLYEMTFDGSTWTLLRTKSDFSPLHFHQRFTGAFEEEGTVISGAWESSADGSTWNLDFELTYRKR